MERFQASKEEATSKAKVEKEEETLETKKTDDETGKGDKTNEAKQNDNRTTEIPEISDCEHPSILKQVLLLQKTLR